MKIGVDLISGESHMGDLVHGCIEAVEKDRDIEVVLIGKSEAYRPYLSLKKYCGKDCMQRISILDAEDVITMDDDPISVVKHKKNSSMIKGLMAHKNGEIDAFFSPGNTGALVVASALILGRVKGIKKPALAAIF